MKLRVPRAPLNDLVEVIWLLPRASSSRPQAAVQRELALPTGTVELVVDLDDDRIVVFEHHDLDRAAAFEGPVLCGVHTRPFAIDTARPGRTLGVHFKPGGASAMLPIAAHALENVHVELEQVIGAAARQLRDELDCVAHDDELLLSTMEAYLLRSIRQELHPAMRNAIKRLDGDWLRPEVKTLVDESGYSHRRFNELFRNTVGLGAKQFSRVARFQHALRYIEGQSDVDWQDVVAECEFYDQAHLIHEFQRHAGLSPTAYVAQRGLRFNHPVVP
ncbi:MAG: AraC family transcriptional regulator [Gammaproteobacteria bacterium]|nr:AraC family transcriptional regulator [Gammaproteobacteria bacterium]